MERNIILEFINHINRHDVDAIASLLSDDHIFTDTDNNTVIGKENMKTAWKLYFDWFPDYTIEISDIIQGETCIAAFGFASATYLNLHNEQKSNHWHIPASWKIILENEKIKLWQVYADTKIIFDITKRNNRVI